MKRNFRLQNLSENYAIPDVYVKKNNEDSVKLSFLIGQSCKVIFRFTESDCDACVNHTLDNIERACTSIKPENFIVLTSYYNIREFNAFINAHKLKLRVYCIPNECLRIPLEKTNTPYLFVLDHSMLTKFVFIPAKEVNNFTQDYLQTLQKRLFN